MCDWLLIINSAQGRYLKKLCHTEDFAARLLAQIRCYDITPFIEICAGEGFPNVVKHTFVFAVID